MIRAVSIGKSYDYTVLDSISLEVNKKESLSITGVSGSGKSTLLHILSTFLKPTSGSVALEGRDIYSLSDKKILQIRRKDIGIIFQDHYLFRGFSARENLEVAAKLSNEKIDEEILEIFDIKDVIDQQVGELSGGQRQRVSIARVLQKRPKYIFADEPTGNLDKKNAINVMNALSEYIKSRGACMVFATHDMELAKKCDFCYKIEEKQAKQWSL